jgi:hypothetical protein
MGGRTAALSELVKRMGLLIIVSRLPLSTAVTVMVKGERATALEGALISRIAWPEPQPTDINPAIATLNERSSCALNTLPIP